jgi:hypothetical protein
VTHDGQCCTSPSIGLEQSLSADTLVLQAEGTPRLAIARSNITTLERWNEGQPHMLAGGLLGALGGAVVGGLIGYQSGCGHCDGDWRPLGAIGGVLVGGVVGALAGVVVGSYRRGFWETIP